MIVIICCLLYGLVFINIVNFKDLKFDCLIKIIFYVEVLFVFFVRDGKYMYVCVCLL